MLTIVEGFQTNVRLQGVAPQQPGQPPPPPGTFNLTGWSLTWALYDTEADENLIVKTTAGAQITIQGVNAFLSVLPADTAGLADKIGPRLLKAVCFGVDPGNNGPFWLGETEAQIVHYNPAQG